MRFKHFSILKRVLAKFALKGMPYGTGASGLIERELYLLRLRDSFQDIQPLDALIVPKFLLDQFNVECEEHNCPKNQFAGIELKASNDNKFGFTTSTRLYPKL